MYSLINDVRLALRHLSRSPGFVLVAVLTLGLGIGINTAIFSVVNVILFRPLPYDNADRIVAVHRQNLENSSFGRWSYPHFEDYRDGTSCFSNLVAWSGTEAIIGRADDSKMRMIEMVSGDYFEALGATPLSGRFFTRADDTTPRAHNITVLGHHFWQQHFQGDPRIIGRTIAINGHDFTVIGVAPEGFTGIIPALHPDLWVTMMMEPIIRPEFSALESRGSTWMDVFGVIKPGVSLEQVNAELALIASTLRETDPQTSAQEHALAIPMRGVPFNPDDRPQAYAMTGLAMGMVGIVLLIACANVANLLLARASTRRREIGIRLALGSSRARLVRHLLVESLLVALTGGGLGLLLAMWAISSANLFIPELPMNATMTLDFSLDFNLLAFAIVISALTGILFGLFPALQSARADLLSALKDEGAHSTRFNRSRLRSSLVVAQVAASMVLLIASGLFVRSLLQARSLEAGFSHENTLAITLDFARHDYDAERGRVYAGNLLARLRDLPGVESAAFDGSPPLGMDLMKSSVWIEGDTITDASGAPTPRMVRMDTVSDRTFETLEIPVLMGREFDERDRADSIPGLIVNQTFAESFWPGENPLDKGIAFTTRKSDGSGWGPGDYRPVIGVVRTVPYAELGEAPQPAVFRCTAHDWDAASILLVRAAGDPQALLPTVRDVIRDVDPNFAPSDVRTFTSLISFKLMPARLAAGLCLLFGALALGLAMIGLYGVMAYMVAQRTHEIGVRMAIGAEKTDVLKLVMRQGLTLTGLGLGIGLLVSLGFAQALKTMLYDVSPADPVTFASIAVLLLLVAGLAILIPARRAMKVDPMVALRYE